MRWSLLAAISASPLVLSVFAFGAAPSPGPTRISGPFTHENLTVYFIHGPSAPGKAPLTLAEALAKRAVVVRETGSVNELEVENIGLEEVFIQSGDIVKGGQQDRTLMVSLVLPPKSGRIQIASFCVEEGRWSARGREDVRSFSTASAALPTRELKLAIRAPRPAAPPVADPSHGIVRSPVLGGGAETGERQREVWENVRRAQALLSSSLGARVNAPESASSLQLAIENERLIGAQRGYVNAIKAAGERDSDIIGFVFAINGSLNSGDVYPSNELFRKMWGKLLDASAIEAIGKRHEPRGEAPTTEAAKAFLDGAEAGAASDRDLNAGVRLVTREGDKAFFLET